MATAELPVKDRNSAFRRVANYIFGGNEKQQKIAMTAPVVMREYKKRFTMSFIMPKEYAMLDLPRPRSADVKLEQVPSRTLAVLRFSGLLSEPAIARHSEKLLDALTTANIKWKDVPFTLGYNGPWTLPFLRRNEVAVMIRE